MTVGRPAPWPTAKAWLSARWPGPMPATGFLLAGFELGARLFTGRTVDAEVMPFAIALILWESAKRKAEKK